MIAFAIDAPSGTEGPRFEAVDRATRNVGWRLFRHFNAGFAADRTSWLLTDGTVVGTQPADATTILVTLHGGRNDLTPAQAAVALAAGTPVVLPDGSTWDPAVGLTWDQTAGFTWLDLAAFPWSAL